MALDDFGSGYTSFRQLKALSVDIVKIDGSFIKDLTDNSDSRFFVKTLLDFTSGFGLKSVAEFVENGETAKMLMEFTPLGRRAEPEELAPMFVFLASDESSFVAAASFMNDGGMAAL